MIDRSLGTPTRARPRRVFAAAALLWLAFVIPALAADTVAQRHGGWRLGQASSPYLQMHRDNPVEWYPWGEEALARARAENKPLFISVGYFTCHWCHVMERESFRNPEIARLLNDGFIAIKIDREQRPDLDSAYMRFVVATKGYGGWPMTVLATPDGTPFFGGTYFPPHDRANFSGLDTLLRNARALWNQDRQNVVDVSRQAVAELIRMHQTPPPLKSLTPETLVEARRLFRTHFDPANGGFGFAPKFPEPAQLLFLLQDEDPQSVEMARFTLDRMAAGGIQDHLEGGFHRYATDADWRVPHFEKMLYDQALIARAYLAAFRRSGETRYAEVARRILDFSLAQLRDRRGGFYSALSADSAAQPGPAAHLEEGAYYVWDWKQLRAAIPDLPMRQWAIARYGLKQGGNVSEGNPPELIGKNILYLAKTEAELAEQFGEKPATVRERLATVDRRLTSARRLRPAPPRDDKIVTSWNGYMITALAEAAQLLNEPRYRRAAEDAARFLLQHSYHAGDNRLYRDWRDGVRGVAAFSEDYAALAEGLLALYALTGDKPWLESARRLTDAQIDLFWDPADGGFYSVGRDTALWMREKSASDHVTPSPSAMALGNLLKLGRLTGERRYTDLARRTAAWQGGALRESPDIMPYALQYWSLLVDAKPPGKTP